MIKLSPAALKQVRIDPARPRYHLCPPVGWMNDPNGAVFYKGYYHVFYQWNPYADTWGSIHWGHARSRDLVTWEHLPAALEPAAELGEEHCFSGCLALREKGAPIILYTAIGPQMNVRDNAQQWGALGDDELITWQKHPRNPLLTGRIHGDSKVLEWRDPFVFVEAGRIFLLLGGKLTGKAGNAAVVLLYEAKDSALEEWCYRGILFRHPDPARISVECANFFKSGGGWVLLLSSYRQVEYYTGDFDPQAGTFTPQEAGLLDGSERFYATNLLLDDLGRTICFGWIRGFTRGRGWNGCLSLPRLLWIDPQGSLRQAPADEVNRLHGPGLHAADIPLGAWSLAGFQSDGMDVHAVLECEPQVKIGVSLIPINPEAQAVTLSLTADAARLNDQAVAIQRPAGAAVDIRLFLDRSVVEVFIDPRACLTLVLPPAASAYRVELFAENARATLRRLEAWEMVPNP